jgi:dienelactone hydrolase
MENGISSLLHIILLALAVSQACVATSARGYKDRGFILAGEQANAFLCRPDRAGPFPAVVFSHGRAIRELQAFESAEDLIGKHLCQRLASDGFLAFIPIREFYRRDGRENILYNLAELLQAVDYVKSLPEVDPNRVALMGHSRGGLLTLMAGLERKDLKALVIAAPADIRPYFSQAVARSASLNTPVLLLVEVSDERGGLGRANFLDDALRKRDKEVLTIRYDRGGGHHLFTTKAAAFDWYWWDDLRKFLRDKLA